METPASGVGCVSGAATGSPGLWLVTAPLPSSEGSAGPARASGTDDAGAPPRPKSRETSGRRRGDGSGASNATSRHPHATASPRQAPSNMNPPYGVVPACFTWNTRRTDRLARSVVAPCPAASIVRQAAHRWPAAPFGLATSRWGKGSPAGASCPAGSARQGSVCPPTFVGSAAPFGGVAGRTDDSAPDRGNPSSFVSAPPSSTVGPAKGFRVVVPV